MTENLPSYFIDIIDTSLWETVKELQLAELD